ncbi:MAG: MFS transporter [Clostridia bacterium]|jgi:MFS family permease|nr:MFS transporter [Clostridia bacterium]
MKQTIDKTEVKPRIWTKNFVLISFATFFLFISFQMLLPILPDYAVSLGVNKSYLGLITGSLTITSIFFRPFVGRAVDTYGRKVIYLIGLCIYLSAMVGYFFATTLFFMLALRVVHGAGWAATSGGAVTIVADITPESRRGEGMGYYGVCNTLAMAVAPALGLFILDGWGYLPVFAVGLAATILTTLFASLIKLPPYTAPDKQAQKVSMFEKRAFRVSLTLFFTTISYGVIVTFLPLYAAEHGIANIGLFFTVYALGLLVSRPTCGIYYDRRGPKLLILGGSLLLVVSLLTLAFAQDLSHFLIAGVLYGFGFGAVQPTIYALSVEGIEPHRRGAATSMVMASWDLGMGIGAIVLGFIANYTSYSFVYLLSSLFILAALGSFFLFRKKPAVC